MICIHTASGAVVKKMVLLPAVATLALGTSIASASPEWEWEPVVVDTFSNKTVGETVDGTTTEVGEAAWGTTFADRLPIAEDDGIRYVAHAGEVARMSSMSSWYEVPQVPGEDDTPTIIRFSATVDSDSSPLYFGLVSAQGHLHTESGDGQIYFSLSDGDLELTYRDAEGARVRVGRHTIAEPEGWHNVSFEWNLGEATLTGYYENTAFATINDISSDDAASLRDNIARLGAAFYQNTEGQKLAAIGVEHGRLIPEPGSIGLLAPSIMAVLSVRPRR